MGKSLSVELENHNGSRVLAAKIVIVREGMKYDDMVRSICNRFSLNCDPSNLKLYFKPKLTDRTLKQCPTLYVCDDYDFEGFLGCVVSGSKGPSLRVKLPDSELVVENVGSNLNNVASNNVKAVKNVGAEEELDICGGGDIGKEADVGNGAEVYDPRVFVRDVDSGHGNVGEVVVREVVEDSGDVEGEGGMAIVYVAGDVKAEGRPTMVNAAEVNAAEGEGQGGIPQLEQFRAQLMALDKCSLVNESSEVEESQNPSASFSDGSDLKVGDIFENKEATQKKIKLVAMVGNFQCRTEKSMKTVLSVRCLEKKCSWRIRLSKIGSSQQFSIRAYVAHHTCGLKSVVKNHLNASYDVVAKLIVSRFEVGKGLSPRKIQSCMQQEFGCDIIYWRAWKARQKALEMKRGNPEMGYAVIPEYLEVLKRVNPGSVTAMEVENDSFKYCFLAYGASLHGFKFVRKVLRVDGTWLKGRYKGTLLCASAQDGNGQIFPLAFDVVNTENDDSWTWFLQKLKDCVPDNEELCFISDRHVSIKKAVRAVYPSASHGLCTVHLWKNIATRYKCYHLQTTFNQACHAYMKREFDTHMDIIKHSKPERVYSYLRDKVGFERFSMALFPGNRYNLMTTNIAESLNSNLRVQREWPLFALLVAIQDLLSRWFFERRTNVMMNNQLVTPEVVTKILERNKCGKFMVVKQLNEDEFQVCDANSQYLVNLKGKTCTCLEFDVECIPCKHVIAALVQRDGEDKNKLMEAEIQKLCHLYYSTEFWVNAYQKTIYPTPPFVEWMTSAMVEEGVKPLIKNIERGRRKVNRIPSAGENPRRVNKKRRKCSNCGREGHYCKRCLEKNNDALVEIV